MVSTRGGHIDLSASSEARPSASAPQDPFQASQALTVPSSKGIAPEVIIKRPMVTTPLIPGNSDCRAKPFHFELYFDMEAMRQQPNLRDSFGLLQRIYMGFYFGPHHLIMVALLYFEEKVHRKKLHRADTIPLLFLRLLCHILEHMGYPTEPHLERHHHCRNHFTLDQWTQLAERNLAESTPEAALPRPIQQHLGLAPPQTDIPGPSELRAPAKETIPAEETITTDVPPQATHETAP
uniref:Uncharacterized protein n=1 Tax=Vitis vinifera TaxID=29760 RepID=A5B0N7_VITVI|nr:hypothetical protein VITISV_009611 [Vitis vinifera]